jgi:predicted Zn-dependent peptidase
MKKYILTLIISVAGLMAMAQSETTSFDVDGIKVIYKPTQKNLINFRLYFRAGVADYPVNKAGIESFAIEAATQCGTKKYTGNEFKDIADKYGILFSGSSMQDYGYMQFNCIPQFFNNTWDLFTEAVMNPVFNENEVQILKDKLITRAKGIQSSPDERLEQLLMKNAFEGTAYEADPDGTEESLASLTASDLKEYYNTILNKNRVFLVVVGKIEKEELINKIKASFATMPSKSYTPVVYQMPAFNDNKVLVEKRDLQTNYLGAVMNAPRFTDPDFIPFRMGMGAFGGLLFRQLRTNLHLSYAQGAHVRSLQMSYAEMYVSTTKPKEAAMAMNTLLKRAKDFTLSEKALREIKSSYVTSNYMRQQSSASITANLGTAEILGGWQYEDNLPGLVDNATVEGIKDSFNKHIIGLRWSYLGSQALADDASDAFKQPLK